MENTTMSKSVMAMMVALALVIATMVGIFAARAQADFTDVPTSHWAYSYIDKMAKGGLIKGYGNNKFGPNDTFTVAQMATIICNAKGIEPEGKNGYWAYGALDYCKNKLKCLPDLGELTAKNYDVPCTREVAFWMLMTGLGPNTSAKKDTSITSASIPDYSKIDKAYQSAVLEAYQYGLSNGTDDAMTFEPKLQLKRSEAAAMFVRAGYTEAGMNTDKNGNYIGEDPNAEGIPDDIKLDKNERINPVTGKFEIYTPGFGWTEFDKNSGGGYNVDMDPELSGEHIGSFG